MFDKFKKRLKKIKEADAAKEAGGKVETLTTAMKVGKIVSKHLNRDYKKTGSVDLVELVSNSLDITMGIMVQLGLGRELKEHWDYYVEFYNCYNHETYLDVVAPDVKDRLLVFHSGSSVYPVLNRFTQEEYEQAIATTVKNKKDSIMKFWDKYVETQTAE